MPTDKKEKSEILAEAICATEQAEMPAAMEGIGESVAMKRGALGTIYNYIRYTTEMLGLGDSIKDTSSETQKLVKEKQETAEADTHVAEEILYFGYSPLILHAIKDIILGNTASRRSRKFYSMISHNLYLTTDDGVSIGSFIFKPKEINEDTQYFIMCHGKGGSRYEVAYFFDFMSMAQQNNAVVLLIDYRSFGDSEGVYSIDGVNYDVKAAFDYLHREYKTTRISLVGHSLGCAVALEYMRFAKAELGLGIPHRVFVLSPFTSTVEILSEFKLFHVFSYFLPTLPQFITTNFNYTNVSNAKGLGDRLMVFHGAHDTIIPPEHGRLVAQSAECPFYTTQNNHVNIFCDKNVWSNIIDITRGDPSM